MPLIRSEDLIDAHGVAEIVGLAHRNSVSQYQRLYGDMPRPVVRLANGKILLWNRPEIERWAKVRQRGGRSSKPR
ncbi:MAG: hypothetical protein ACJ76P_03230 [Actinomycetota bacterium]